MNRSAASPDAAPTASPATAPALTPGIHRGNALARLAGHETLDLRCMLVTDAAIADAAGHTLPTLVAAAAAGGVTVVQVREKHGSAPAFLDAVLQIDAVLPPHIALLVNDRVDVALAARAQGARVAGVHVGQDDLPAKTVRTLLGADAIVGVSAATPAQLHAAAAAGADYVGIGALRGTSTKTEAPALGLERLTELIASSSLPAVAIGGVRPADLRAIRAAGASGVAVVSAICGAADPRRAAAELLAAWEAAA